jgi:adenylyltransferase/sulfurtransferase
MQNPHINRYKRQSILDEIGDDGQNTLKKSSALIIGCGALGNVIADHLTRAGIGKIRIVDRDIVELENLQRQILFDETDIGKPKAIAAQEKLKKVNSEIEIEALLKDFNPNNAEKIFGETNIVLDGTDNMETRYLINDICVKKEIPWIYGGAVSTYGMSMNIVPQDTPCLVCAFPKIPKAGSLPTCDTVGVLNTVPSIIASIQVTEALKILLGKVYKRDLIIFDVWTQDFQAIKIRKTSDCNCCSNQNYLYLNSKKVEITTKLCGNNSVQINPGRETVVSFENLAERLKNVGDVKLSPVHMIFETQDAKITLFSDGRAIVKGTDDETKAKSIYAKYIGN